MSDTVLFLKNRLKRMGFSDEDLDVNEAEFVYDDGGMYASGDSFREFAPRQKTAYLENVAAHDHIRAIAIASGFGWAKIKEEYKQFENEHGEFGRSWKKHGSGVKGRELEHAKCVRAFIEEVLGWEWKPVMKIGSGVTMHCRKRELPKGDLILKCSKYFMASIDGVIHDTYDYTRDGTRAVYGYWKSKGFFTPENYRLFTGEK